ncbi:MAG: 3-deoxy-manno-octulosonate cytidylyltransferase [Planctomycetota bacterium]|nr:3-deoxy-manno-octulosonate cytidylyltransferase [Planctomycetota bacterium]
MSASERTVAVVIPARLGSRRFPRKILARDTGKYLIQHVWERVVDCPGVSRVVIATDSEEIVEACTSFGAEARMTSAGHRSGTDRVAELAENLDEDIIVNVQGDEPYISHTDILALLELFDGSAARDGQGVGTVMATLAAERRDSEGLHDPNVVKAVVSIDGRALYFSRAPVPPAPAEEGDGPVDWLQHIGIYAYTREFLLRFAGLEPTALERREKLEQLRALENGYTIRIGKAQGQHMGIDTEEEYTRFVEEEKRRKEDGPISEGS